MSHARTFGIILPAAGSGTRFGSGDKLLVELNGRSVLQHSVGLFANRPEVGTIIIVTAPERFDTYRAHLQRHSPSAARHASVQFVAGGRERWESVIFGLRALAAVAEAPEFVAVHDAARPLCPAQIIDDAFRAAIEHGAALPCVPEPATLKRRGPGGTVSETVSRSGLFQAQTPQCFGLKNLLAGYEELLGQGLVADLTDDAQVFERTHHPVFITAGAADNLKITTAADVELARAILQTRTK